MTWRGRMTNRHGGRPRHHRTRVLLLGLAALMIAIAAPADAQNQPDAGFIRVEARITGDGPWTSWLGGRAERTAIITIENTSDVSLVAPELVLWLDADGPAQPIAVVSLPDLDAGERTTVDADFSLPRFSFGTHALEGTLTGAEDPVALRAETTHIPWLLLLLPTLALAQVGLASLRNRARRRLHQDDPAPAASSLDPADSIEAVDGSEVPASAVPAIDDRADQPPSTVASFIERELDAALADLARWRLDDDRFLLAVQQRARGVTRRVSDRFDIPAADMPDLAGSITTALLERAASPRRVSA